MEISKQLFTLIIVCTIVMAVSVTYIASPIIRSAFDPRSTVNVTMEIFDESGNSVMGSVQAHNIITDIGERCDRNVMGFSNVTAWNGTKYLANGNASSIAASLTQLTNETGNWNFSRVGVTPVTWMNGTDYSYNVTYTWMSTGSFRINAVSLHWAITTRSDNNMYAVVYITDGTYHQFQTGWTLRVTWTVTRNCN